MKEPDKLKTERLRRMAKYQELEVARRAKAKIYMLSDGDTFIWINLFSEGGKREEKVIWEKTNIHH